MVQFNLLPDIKLEYIRVQKTKRTVQLIAGLVGAVSLGIMLLLFVTVNVIQKTHLNNLNDDIERYSQELRYTPELDKVLTVQNQLSRINELHDKKPVTSRLLGYITQVTPNSINISQLNVDFAANTMSLSGNTVSLKDINQFVDTLKFTKYAAGEGEELPAFSNVVLASFERGDEQSIYSITLGFDPVIFSSQNDVRLIVPKTTTTRSVTEKPSPLFGPTNPEAEGEQ